MQVPSLIWEDPLEEGMATHSGILVWEIPWTEQPGGLTVHRVTESWTRLKRLSTQEMEDALRPGSPGTCVLDHHMATVHYY